MRIPFVPSLPGPAPAVVRRVLGDDADAAESTGADTDVAGQPVPTVASGAGPGASAADPRLATPPLRVDRSSDADRNPVLTAADVADTPHVSFVADPFVVRAGSADAVSEPYHCFFEVKRRDRRPFLCLRDTEARFDIGHATSPDGRDWTYEGVVLPAAQAEHTYPHVFHHDDDWWMVPSPAGSTPDELRVYRAADFPTDWELVETTLAGEVRIDPTPFEYDGTWFLVHQAPDYTVRLRYSDRLVGGEWHEHPASPLFDPGGNDIAPGGRPLVDASAGTVDLFFRRGDPGIVEAWRVVDPSRDEWSMHELPTSPVVSGSGEPGAWDERNVHHVDAGLARATGSDLVLVDGQDADRRYRLGVARTRDFDGGTDEAERAALASRTVHPGERAVLSVTGTLAVPEGGWYRVSVRPQVESPGPVAVETTCSAGAASASGTFDVAADGRGHVALGPVALAPGDRPVVELQHDGGRPVRVTGGAVRLRGW
ncbi:glucosamine inositolphosphorylceramide transferase family protein [Haloglomus salinum]|uniref:glucosamine inositolphosphorylceramide transferase family protein n=1 Tax=Haloglomus salinum TaxID=2962673 RepID=UPI0020CA18E0|nr:hypothetical protein [Haloglomus salinum]